MADRNWSPNEKQKLFIKTLEGSDGMTLKQASVAAGIDFATGTINPLVSKGLVVIAGEADGQGTKKVAYKVYGYVADKTADGKWTPNDKQVAFLKVLKDNPDGLTLKQASVAAGIEFATGTINSLTTKGLVQILGETEMTVPTTRKVKVYKLA